MNLIKEKITHLANLEKKENSVFLSTSNDPQIYFNFDKPLKYGWFKFSCNVAIPVSFKTFYAKLFFDLGNGYSEDNSIDIALNNGAETSIYVKLNENCNAIRFDPHENMTGGIELNIQQLQFKRENRNLVFLSHILKDKSIAKATYKAAIEVVKVDFKKIKKNIKYKVVDHFEFPKKADELKPQKIGTNTFSNITHFMQNKSEFYQVKREFKVLNTSIKTIAFYLPQFHPIKQNDKNWGTGFTEWTNTTKAIPHFENHYQPHLPGDLGFYNLSNKESIKAQIEIAKLYGIYGFCIYNYWFDGIKVLEKPLEIIYENKDLDINYMVCWANENWTKRWDGLDEDVLLKQNYNEKSDNEYFLSVLKYFKDSRYIKINEKPALIVYKPSLFPNFKKTVSNWRKLAKENGLNDIYVMAVKGFGCDNPKDFGLDALYEFPPATPAGYIELDNEDKKNLAFFNQDFSGKIYDYRKVANNLKKTIYNDHTVYKGLMLGWDNVARTGNKAHIFQFANPEVYQNWLYEVAKYTHSKFDENNKFIFINAWNEWAEGTHLEPDRYYGYAYLDKTSQVLEYFPKKIKKIQIDPQNIGFCIHIYYYDLWEEILVRLKKLNFSFNLFISITDDSKGKAVELKNSILKHYPQANIRVVKNKGRDVLPFIEFIDDILKSGCKYLCKIHTKKSHHREDGDIWRNDLYSKLFNDKRLIETILNYFSNYSEIGIIGPEGHLLNTKNYWGYNKKLVFKLAKELGHTDDNDFHFIAGTMFWIRTDILKSLKTLNLKESDFENEKDLTNIKDGTLSHAIERIISICCSINNKMVVDTRIFNGELNIDFESIKRTDPNNYDYAIPIIIKD